MFSGSGLEKPDPVLLRPTVQDLTLRVIQGDKQSEGGPAVRSKQWSLDHTWHFPTSEAELIPCILYQAAALWLLSAPCWRCPLSSTCTLKLDQFGQLHLVGVPSFIYTWKMTAERKVKIFFLVIMQELMTLSYLTVRWDRLFLGQAHANYWHHAYLQGSVLPSPTQCLCCLRMPPRREWPPEESQGHLKLLLLTQLKSPIRRDRPDHLYPVIWDTWAVPSRQ